MKKEIELKRLKQIDFLELFTYKEIYGKTIKLCEVFLYIEDSEKLLNYSVKFIDNIIIESYPGMRRMFKKIYYDIENSEDIITDNFQANKKIEKYKLNRKLNKLPIKNTKHGVKKI